MTGSSQRDYLIKASMTVIFAALVLAGVWLYHDDARFPRTPATRPIPAPQEKSVPPATQFRPLQPEPENSRTGTPPWPDSPRILPPVNGSRPFATPAPPPNAGFPAPPVIVGDEKPAFRSGEPQTDGGAAAHQDEPIEKTTPVPGTDSDTQLPAKAEPSPNQEEENIGGYTEEQAAGQTPLIIYGKGNAADARSGVVRGEIPADQAPPDTTALYGSPGSSRQKNKSARVHPRGEDSVAGLAVIEELAKFLADNYWPAGTHPRAHRQGISTVTVRWANAKFGVSLREFSVNQADIVRERTRVLNYVFMPSMVRGLYDLYSERFFAALEREALSQRRGPEERPFSKAELAEMYGLYETMARGLAGTARAYADTPGARALSRAYLDAERQAEEVHQRLLAARQNGSSGGTALAEQYRTAVLQREQQRETLTSALRRSGSTHGLDSDSVLYTALWLYRRGDGSRAATRALADILDQCADSLEKKQHRTGAGQKTSKARTKQ